MNPKETAVVFIEFENEFCREKGFCHPLVEAEMRRLKTVENAQKVLKFCRESGILVIHCPFVFDPKWFDTKKPGGLQEIFAQENAFQPGTWGTAIIEEMQPLENEIVLVGKRGLSGFSNTNLQAFLEANGIRNLFVCGFLTNLCVQTTAISAYDNGYRTRIIADACASGSPQIQQYVEETICPVLGGLVKSDDFLLLF